MNVADLDVVERFWKAIDTHDWELIETVLAENFVRVGMSGEASDTWSANPLSCAAVLSTLDEFESTDVLKHVRALTPVFLKGLESLKQTGLVSLVRGEGLVFGFECSSFGPLSAGEVAAKIVEGCYLGKNGGSCPLRLYKGAQNNAKSSLATNFVDGIA